ncbi:MAG: hypothetical protein WKG07_22575 [Hymenobacter sp.]
MYDELLRKEAKLAVIGLGYVGLPIALEFAKQLSVIGFDINAGRVEMMRNHQDPSGELDQRRLRRLRHHLHRLARRAARGAASSSWPCLRPLTSTPSPTSSRCSAPRRRWVRCLKKGDYVVFESTVYPGCTEEDCIPVMEQILGPEASPRAISRSATRPSASTPATRSTPCAAS